MKKIFLHIGTHKTGTTSIQVFGVNNLEELIKKGYYYPRTARPVIRTVSYGHHLLPWYILRHPIPDTYWGKYAANKEEIYRILFEEIEKSDCDKIIISSEEFDTLSEKQIYALRELFNGYDLSIIVYLRRKDAYVESMYQTMVIHGQEGRHIEEILKGNFRCPLNYYDFIEKWRAVFGLENVCVRLYCPETLDLQDIVVDFYNRIGFNVSEMISQEGRLQTNTSVPLHYVALVAMLRRGKAGRNTIDRCIRIAKRMKGKSPSGFHFLSVDQRRALAESGRDELQRLNIFPEDDPVLDLFSLKSSDDETAASGKRNFEGLGRVLMDFEKLIAQDDKQDS